MTKEEDIFTASVKKWGLRSQILMLAEEASELSVACLHWLRKKKQCYAAASLAEEMADCELMLDEIKLALGFQSWCQQFREDKLTRLEQYLKEDPKNELQRKPATTGP